jgi:trehalose-phosphatase
MRGSVRGVDRAIAAWQARPADARPLVLLDFDGTLADFQIDPASVTLPPPRLKLLQTLAARADMSGGIISGRRIADVRERAFGGSSLFYAGLHGLEIEGPGLRYVHPALALAAPTIGVLADEVRAATKELPGVFIEDKGYSVVLHVRGASKADRQHAAIRFETLSAPFLAGGVVRLQRGDNVFELLPNIDWTKGDAVKAIARHVEAQTKQPTWPVYIGDDATDEDAFEAIGDSGLTIGVTARTSGAAFSLPDTSAVEQFLRAAVATE